MILRLMIQIAPESISDKKYLLFQTGCNQAGSVLTLLPLVCLQQKHHFSLIILYLPLLQRHRRPPLSPSLVCFLLGLMRREILTLSHTAGQITQTHTHARCGGSVWSLPLVILHNPLLLATVCL